jgi:hypothetical protein
MSEHALLAIISILVTIAIALLTILLTSLRTWKREIKATIDKVCESNEKDHGELWERVNHHWHNGGGNVVIPTSTVQRGA